MPLSRGFSSHRLIAGPAQINKQKKNNPSRYDNKRCKSSAIFFLGRKETTMKIRKHNLTMNPTHANESIENTTQHTITS